MVRRQRRALPVRKQQTKETTYDSLGTTSFTESAATTTVQKEKRTRKLPERLRDDNLEVHSKSYKTALLRGLSNGVVESVAVSAESPSQVATNSEDVVTKFKEPPVLESAKSQLTPEVLATKENFEAKSKAKQQFIKSPTANAQQIVKNRQFSAQNRNKAVCDVDVPFRGSVPHNKAAKSEMITPLQPLTNRRLYKQVKSVIDPADQKQIEAFNSMDASTAFDTSLLATAYIVIRRATIFHPALLNRTTTEVLYLHETKPQGKSKKQIKPFASYILFFLNKEQQQEAKQARNAQEEQEMKEKAARPAIVAKEYRNLKRKYLDKTTLESDEELQFESVETHPAKKSKSISTLELSSSNQITSSFDFDDNISLPSTQPFSPASPRSPLEKQEYEGFETIDHPSNIYVENPFSLYIGQNKTSLDNFTYTRNPVPTTDQFTLVLQQMSARTNLTMLVSKEQEQYMPPKANYVQLFEGIKDLDTNKQKELFCYELHGRWCLNINGEGIPKKANMKIGGHALFDFARVWLDDHRVNPFYKIKDEDQPTPTLVLLMMETHEAMPWVKDHGDFEMIMRSCINKRCFLNRRNAKRTGEYWQAMLDNDDNYNITRTYHPAVTQASDSFPPDMDELLRDQDKLEDEHLDFEM